MAGRRQAIPHDRDFIFTIFDDTDVATLEYIRPIYDFLLDAGLRTTKSVWPLPCDEPSDYAGSHTLADEPYAVYLRGLQAQGVEMAFHGATMCSSRRQDTAAALWRFREVFGRYPRCYAPHSRNRENLYWGRDRLTIPFLRKIYDLLSDEPRDHYQGHLTDSPYFWGDWARRNLDYIRNFTCQATDMRRVFPRLCYSTARQSWVRAWFVSADADNVNAFNHLLRPENQERLQRDQGICIISTHFGKGFLVDGELHPTTRALLERLSRRNGWFAPVSDVLDFITGGETPPPAPFISRLRMELAWLRHSARRRKHRFDYQPTEVDYLLAGRQALSARLDE
jgi:hypothetical protein